MQRLNHWLNVLSIILGAAVTLYGFFLFFSERALPPLLVALAVLIVGPLEDRLKARVARSSATQEEKAARTDLADKATSAAFLLLLLVAIAL